jgi:peptidyl-prolyl cis-trans isomerase C
MRKGWINRASLGLGLIVGLLLGGCESTGNAPKDATEENSASVAPDGAVRSDAKGTTAGGAVPDGSPVVARYGSQVLTETALVTELERLPSRSRSVMNDEGRHRFVENYVLNEILFTEGTARGYAEDPEIQRQIDDLRKRLVVQKVVRELQDIPRANRRGRPGSVRPAPRALLDDDHSGSPHPAEGRRRGQGGRAKAVAKPDSFADLAKEHSLDKASARKGGDLGFFGHGRMVPEFEEVAFAMKKPGEISEVVHTQYGFHIIQLQERREGEPKPFDQVKEQIRAVMRNKTLRDRTDEYYDELKKKANVQIDDAAAERAAQKVPEPSPVPRAASTGWATERARRGLLLCAPRSKLFVWIPSEDRAREPTRGGRWRGACSRWWSASPCSPSSSWRCGSSTWTPAVSAVARGRRRPASASASGRTTSRRAVGVEAPGPSRRRNASPAWVRRADPGGSPGVASGTHLRSFRASPTRRVIPLRSKCSSRATAYFLLAAIRSRNSATVISGRSPRKSTTRRRASSRAARS